MDLKKSVLGLELGSTRIKAVLIDSCHKPIASGSYDWENKLIDGVWTYSLDDVHTGIQECFGRLKQDVKSRYGTELTSVGAIGVSGMMHGYLPFDQNGEQLAKFRTWRNTTTQKAAAELTELFNFNIPQRWSIAHLYQAVLDNSEYLCNLSYLTTLAGYVHWRLTGEKIIGVGEASGMFPINSSTLDYDQRMLEQFDKLIASKSFPWKIRDVFPKIAIAGDCGGYLTEEGALFLDPEGTLKAGIPLAPCEGDAGTGMVATNSVRVHTGNVSAGTSDFAMLVTDKELAVHREIDMVTTPAGRAVAMVHCNNCTSDINAWVDLFHEFSQMIGAECDKGKLFSLLFKEAMQADPDCDGLISYNYFSGEGITDLDEGRPVFARLPNSRFSLANFMRAHLFSALATLRIGLDILTVEEHVQVEKIYAHGGFFKTPKVGQLMLSAAVAAPVSVMETAGEGGPYGMALLAAYMLWKDNGESLEDYLDNKVFRAANSTTFIASNADIEGFSAFLERYKKALPIEATAICVMPA